MAAVLAEQADKMREVETQHQSQLSKNLGVSAPSTSASARRHAAIIPFRIVSPDRFTLSLRLYLSFDGLAATGY